MSFQRKFLAFISLFAYSCCLVMTAPVQQYVSHKSCNNVEPGTFVAHPTNCTLYIRCNGLRSLMGECPDGTFFNEELLSCDKTDHACKAKQEVERPHHQQHSEIPLDAQPDTFLPTGTALGLPLCISWFDQQFPHPYNCEYYYYCLGGYLTIRRCSSGFGWDLDLQKCVPLSKANCFKKFTQAQHEVKSSLKNRL